MRHTILKLCTFEVSTDVGRQRRLGAYHDGRIVDLNFAAAWYMAATGEPEPQRLADALVPSDLELFLKSGLRAIHTAEDLFMGAGPPPADWWLADFDKLPRGPQHETLVYDAQRVRLVPPLTRPGIAGPEDAVTAANRCSASLAAVIGASGTAAGFTICNVLGDQIAAGPYVRLGAVPQLELIVRINGQERVRSTTGSLPASSSAPGDIVPCGAHAELNLSPGDVVEVEIDPIGVLRNRVLVAAA